MLPCVLPLQEQILEQMQGKVNIYAGFVWRKRVAGEPSISIDSQDRIYVAAPFGFSTTASFVWRSTDHGQSFHLVPGDLATFGKPTTCIGGGDSALAVDTANRLYFADLQGLTNVSNSVSSDQGATWLTTCNATNDVGVDRPWIATFKDPVNPHVVCCVEIGRAHV